MPWFVVCLLALISLVGQLFWVGQIISLLLFAGVVLDLSQISQHYLSATCLAFFLGAISLKNDLSEKIRRLVRTYFWIFKPLLVIILIACTLWIANFREKMQYAPDYGYREPPSQDGWGKLCSLVHRELTNQKVLVVSKREDCPYFPVFGNKLTNRIYLSDTNSTARDILEESVGNRIDFIAAFSFAIPCKNNVFEESVIPELIKRFPNQFRVEKKFGPSYLIRVIH
jgi:hypothetical protein